MEVRIREGGDGVRCWNTEPITAYARDDDARLARLTRDNPDLAVTPGQIVCYGCAALEYGHGYGCTAQLAQTLYQVRGEVGPRAADAAGSLSIIPGFLGRIDADASSPAAQLPST